MVVYKFDGAEHKNSLTLQFKATLQFLPKSWAICLSSDQGQATPPSHRHMQVSSLIILLLCFSRSCISCSFENVFDDDDGGDGNEGTELDQDGDLCFNPLAAASYVPKEEDIDPLLTGYASNPEHLDFFLQRLGEYSAKFPESASFHILAHGEYSLMDKPMYFASRPHQILVNDGLYQLFTTSFSFKTIIMVFRTQRDLLKTNPGLYLPESVMCTFISKAKELFTNCNTGDFSRKYKLFLKLFEYCEIIQAHRDDCLMQFHLFLVQAFPKEFQQLALVDQFRIFLDFVYWEHIEGLVACIRLSPESIFFVAEDGLTILHYACRLSRTTALRFLIGLVHEMVLNEPVPDAPSPFALAIQLQIPEVLDVFSEFGYNAWTSFYVGTAVYTAIQYAKEFNYADSLHYFVCQTTELKMF